VLFDDRTFDVYREELDRWEAAEIVSSPDFYAINRTLRDGGM